MKSLSCLPSTNSDHIVTTNHGLNGQNTAPEQLRSIWCTIADVKITFDDKDIDCDVQEIRELLDEDAPRDAKNSLL